MDTRSPIAKGTDLSPGVTIGNIDGDDRADVVIVNIAVANQLFV